MVVRGKLQRRRHLGDFPSPFASLRSVVGVRGWLPGREQQAPSVQRTPSSPTVNPPPSCSDGMQPCSADVYRWRTPPTWGGLDLAAHRFLLVLQATAAALVVPAMALAGRPKSFPLRWRQSGGADLMSTCQISSPPFEKQRDSPLVPHSSIEEA